MTNPDSSEPGGPHQTPPPGHPRVRVRVPVADDLSSAFIELLSVVARLGAFRSVLAGVVALGERAPELSDEQVRTALVRLRERVAPELGGAAR